MYRAPAGRPVSYPPMECLAEAETFTSPPIAIPTGRAAGAFVLRQKLANDPEFRAEYSRKISAGMIAHHRRRAALKAQAEQAKKWHTYADVARATGLTYFTARARVTDAKWPIRRVTRDRHTGVEVFGDPATLAPLKRTGRPRKTAAVAPEATVVPSRTPSFVIVQEAPAPRSFWSRLFGWMVGR